MQAKLTDAAATVMTIMPRIVTDRDLKASAGKACYAELADNTLAQGSAEKPSVSYMPSRALAEISADGWDLGFCEYKLLDGFCPRRFLWYFRPDGSPIQPEDPSELGLIRLHRHRGRKRRRRMPRTKGDEIK